MSAPKIVRNSRGPEEKTINQYCYISNSLLLEIGSKFSFPKRKIEQWQFQTLSITFAETPLTPQSAWDSNVGRSSMDASVSGAQKNSKQDWGINGKRGWGITGGYNGRNWGVSGSYGRNNGKSSLGISGGLGNNGPPGWHVGFGYQKKFGKRNCYCCCCCCCWWVRTVPPFGEVRWASPKNSVRQKNEVSVPRGVWECDASLLKLPTHHPRCSAIRPSIHPSIHLLIHSSIHAPISLVMTSNL